MALFNYATKEITLKIVYYGPGLSGKTTNLQHLHTVLNPETKGKLLSLSTESDRTLFFDFLPVELGKIRDFSIRFQLYTVPGQVRYNATRKVVLKGADAVVFVADSQQAMREQNIESYENMQENLISNNIKPETIPVILQFNKRDLKNILTVDELNHDLNPNGIYDVIEATAISGTGVDETFKKITKTLLKDISKKHKIEIQPAEGKKSGADHKLPELQPGREPAIVPEPKPESPRVELKIPDPGSMSGESIFEPTTFVSDRNSFDIFPEDESDAIEVLEEVSEVNAETDSGLSLPLPEPEPVPIFAFPAAEPEPLFEIPMPPAEPATATARYEEKHEEPASVTTQSFPVEKIDALSEDVAVLSERVGKIVDSLSMLQRTMTDLRGELLVIKNDVAVSKDKTVQKEQETRELREFKELRREQKEISDTLKDVTDLLSSLKEKKNWFKL